MTIAVPSRTSASVFVATVIALVAAMLGVTPPAEAKPSKNITVTTYNICSEKCPGLQTWSQRSKKVVGSIAHNHPDVVLIQEAGKADVQTRMLVKRMKARGYALAGGRKARYIFIRSRTMAVKVGNKKLSGGTLVLQGTRGSKVQYVPWQVVVKKGVGSKTLIIDTHAWVGKSDSADKTRLGEVTKTYGRLHRYITKYTTIWGGDFNSLASDSSTFRCGNASVRWRVDQFMRSKGFLDAAFKTTRPKTKFFSTVNHDPERSQDDCAGQQIDHLYSDRRLAVTTWRTNNRTSSYKGQYSDHDSTTATFTRKG